MQAICEDYRASASIDRQHDDADLARRRIECRVLALWSARGALPRFYGDVLSIWRPWTRHVTGRALPTSHFLAEDEPDEVAGALTAFLQPNTERPTTH